MSDNFPGGLVVCLQHTIAAFVQHRINIQNVSIVAGSWENSGKQFHTMW